MPTFLDWLLARLMIYWDIVSYMTTGLWSFVFLVIATIYLLRIPYMIFLAPYAKGYGFWHTTQTVELIAYGRGTSEFWGACLRQVTLSFAIFIFASIGWFLTGG